MILRKELYEKHGVFKMLYLSAKAGLTILVRSLYKFKKVSLEDKKISTKEIGRNRGLPYLTIQNNGSLQCISCTLCVTYCPSDCIYIETKYGRSINDNGPPDSFKIDILKCIFCGLCEEACPVDAIRMSDEYRLSGHAEQEWVVDQKYLAFRESINKGKGEVSPVALSQLN